MSARDAPSAGREVGGAPPWILGHRGALLEAPENTLASLRRAIERGVDGVEYDVRSCATGEVVLLHDATLDRTTDASGPLAERTLPELFQVDAGAWFAKRFAGEPLPLLDEALDLVGEDARTDTLHMIELKEREPVAEVARALRERRPPVPHRVASFDRETCLEARDRGLQTMLLARRPSEADLEFLRRERLSAYGVGPPGFAGAIGERRWPCELWGWSIDSPDDLLAACRRPLFGFNTNEPRRALAVRRLVALAPGDRGAYPVATRVLPLEPGATRGLRGEWCGRWSTSATIRNPLDLSARVACEVEVRRGAFEVEGLPAPFELAPGASRAVDFELAGGSWSPGGDPLLVVRFRFRRTGARAGEELLLDAPLRRVRSMVAPFDPRRVELLREAPDMRAASMVVRRVGNVLLLSIEDEGGLEEARAVARLDEGVRIGSRGIRLSLPADFDLCAEGVPFSFGFEGWITRPDGRRERALRRWAGGLPAGLSSGEPGRLLPRARS